MNELIKGDRELLLYLNGLGSSSFDSFWLLMTKSLFWLPLFVLFLYLVYKMFKPINILYILLILAAGITASDQLANAFKYGFRRLRPCHDPDVFPHMRLIICGGQYGFYSGHASTSFFVATFLTFLIGKNYKFLPFLAYGWAFLFSYSRLYLGVHYPLDIFVGATFGIVFGTIFSLLTLKWVKKK